MHLLIPFASCDSDECQQTLAGLKLPNLDKLLNRLVETRLDAGDETTLSPPHERALAAALALTANGQTAQDGQLPWAAWQVAKKAQSGHPVANNTSNATITNSAAWAIITPCQWAVQTGHITMTDPAALQLSEVDSQALLAATAPYFEEDGIHLEYDSPTRWLAQGDIFRDLATASLDRVTGRDIQNWFPKAEKAKLLRRLQNEMQMLLYTHPISDARAERGLPPVNSFWVSGTGALPAGDFQPELVGNKSVTMPTTLRDAALAENWPAWAKAWQQIDSKECADLLAASKGKNEMVLTLCGERGAQSFNSGSNTILSRFSAHFKGVLGLKRFTDKHEQL
jgi:hypothetical protein